MGEIGRLREFGFGKKFKARKKGDLLCHILASKWKIDYHEIENYLVNIV